MGILVHSEGKLGILGVRGGKGGSGGFWCILWILGDSGWVAKVWRRFWRILGDSGDYGGF